MNINVVLEAVAAGIKSRLPELAACEVHDGRFDAGELARISARTPACFTACLAVSQVQDPGTEQVDAVLDLAVFVVTRSNPGLDRGRAARNIVSGLLETIPHNFWGLDALGSPETGSIKAQNLYSGRLDKRGAALWAVSWKQTVRLGESIFDDEGVVPSRLYVDKVEMTWA